MNDEDIKILENIIGRDFSNPMGWSGYYDSELKELQQAIKNLLNRNKELEEENKELMKLKNDYNYSVDVVRENTKLRYELFHSIPVAKVEEKIEKLNKNIDLSIDNSKGGLDEEFIDKASELLAQKRILQDLLEGK